jgi:superfamily I DNA and/or RNA helicase
MEEQKHFQILDKRFSSIKKFQLPSSFFISSKEHDKNENKNIEEKKKKKRNWQNVKDIPFKSLQKPRFSKEIPPKTLAKQRGLL